MPIKNKIKIDSFKIEKMRQSDVQEVLKLAVLAQSNFGVTDTVSPSAFLKEIYNLMQDCMRFAFVYRSSSNFLFGAFIIKPTTNISAEIKLFLSHPDIAQTKEMYEEFFKIINASKFGFHIKVLKKRKKFEAYVRFLDALGFSEIESEDERFLTLRYRKLDKIPIVELL